jgi:CheY-like chemotaxis protein
MERARAQAANEARTRFFASASHDLRQPLHALGINAATIRALAEQNQDPRLGRVGEVIHQALNESRSLLDSLLEVSELDAGAVTPQFSTVDVVALLQTVQQTCAPIASEKSLELVCEGAGGPLLAHTDAALLKRMVMNLVGNAIKFTQTGRITLRHASGSEPGGDVLIQVCDTGPGIEPGEQEKVFEEFYQIGNAERDRSRGLGLGLAIVRRIAALSGAKVTLLSEPGNGCVFEIHVPCANVDAVVPPMWDVDGESTWRVALKGKGYRVLIIDDEREVREAMDTFLSVLGWWPKAVGGESEALAVMAQGWSPQAIVLDFRMRGGRSGIEVLSVLREAGCQAPAVLVTGDTAPARIQSARGAGLPLLYKPVDGLQLARSIAGLIHSHSPLHQGSIPEPMRI